MKIKINDKLFKKFKNGYENTGIYNNIKQFHSGQGEDVKFASAVDFINSIQNDLYAKDKSLGIPKIINDIEDIEHGKTPSEYVAQIIKDDGIKVDIVIGYGVKSGNTLVAQQLSSYLLQKVSEDLNYIYDNNKYPKFIYFTYDLNKNNYAPTTQETLRSVKSLGFEIVEMFPSNKNIIPFKSAQELLGFYSSNNKPDGRFSMSMNDSTLEVIGNNINGSTMYINNLLLITIYKLSHPEPVFEKIKIELKGDVNNKENVFKNEYLLKRLFGNVDHLNDFNIFSYDLFETGRGFNKIFYGAPGTGKSFKANEIRKQYDNDMFERVTFFADYDYSDFVGGLKPTKDNYGNISYEFIPGAFTRVLVKALNNPNKEALLIIEELNRAKASAVFGEVFQLLDRDEDGTSEYSVFNKDLCDYLDENVRGFTSFSDDGIKIPRNMSILATMNPSDQGVSDIDNAFKRRWELKYFPIKFDNEISKQNVAGFSDSLTWKQVAETINYFIINKFDVDEDALISQYFMNESQLKDKDAVASKLLGYLWNDISRYSHDDMFKTKTLAETIDNFNKNGYDSGIFCDELIDSLNKCISGN